MVHEDEILKVSNERKRGENFLPPNMLYRNTEEIIRLQRNTEGKAEPSSMKSDRGVNIWMSIKYIFLISLA